MYFNKFLKRVASVFIYGIISTIIAFLIALLIQNRFQTQIYDSMTAIGLIIICIGALLAIGGNSTDADIRGIDEFNGQYASKLNTNIAEMERKTTSYFERTANHARLHFKSSKLNIIINGVFIILSSIVLSCFS